MKYAIHEMLIVSNYQQNLLEFKFCTIQVCLRNFEKSQITAVYCCFYEIFQSNFQLTALTNFSFHKQSFKTYEKRCSGHF